MNVTRQRDPVPMAGTGICREEGCCDRVADTACDGASHASVRSDVAHLAARMQVECIMNVRDAMTPHPISCDPTTTLPVIATLMLDHDCAAVPIVHAGEVLGIVTDRDIVCRAVARGWNTAELTAGAVMSTPLVAIHPDESFDDAVQVMRENHVHHLPVIDEAGQLLGIVAQSDLGRRMSNRELGQLARDTSIRGTLRESSTIVTRSRSRSPNA